MNKLVTRDTAGNINGWVLPLWSALEHPKLRPEQVYVTAIAPGMRKGPHLHMKRRGVFFCIERNRVYARFGFPGLAVRGCFLGEEPVIIEPGEICALYNYGDTEALVINMPSPAWSKEDPDEHEVTDWEDPPGWKHR